MPAVLRTLLIALSLAVAIAGCKRDAPEVALRRDIATMQSAIEARDAGALADGLADDFIGPDGMDRTQAKRFAQVIFLRNRTVGATFGPMDIAMQGEGATVKFTAAVTGGAGGLLPDSGQVFDVTTGWRRVGGDWKLVSAEWAPKS
ncbi:hypothetical protein LYSHEL_28710 [Lysobacter helvus]|uniref:Nuclear transport factor 2 family protein n=2 Tax=Lysobacteraceae TaxID=32033 RepID=A0ABM7Q8S4_9GAMM|nr:MULTISPECIES: nuclear transport factor 2 family protein [Lysobacter]BCT93844.1 hypothetical protein LYSCAS_28680 [Lysobacter caseinilyticus]BCT97000.1 hypothetical protein LYSHEL_28710 [Lysobacter helvus]